MALLPNISGPTDVKTLAAEDLPVLAQEIRERINPKTPKPHNYKIFINNI
jgi:deoxyxylulose-5-phosphate synthase